MFRLQNIFVFSSFILLRSVRRRELERVVVKTKRNGDRRRSNSIAINEIHFLLPPCPNSVLPSPQASRPVHRPASRSRQVHHQADSPLCLP